MLSKWKCTSTLRSARGFSSSSSENSSSSSWLSETVAIVENRRTEMRNRRTAAMAVAVVGGWLPGY